MGLYSTLQLVVVALLAGLSVATGSANQLTLSNAHPWAAASENSIAERRLLRTDKTAEESDSELDNNEERAIPTDILTHVDGLVRTGIQHSTLLNRLDNFVQKLQNRYWLLKGKKPEALKTQLGLHNVADISQHPNYSKWLQYARLYNKHHPDYHVVGLPA